MIMTNGIGAIVGSYVAQAIVNIYAFPMSWYIFAGFALVLAVVFMFAFKYEHKSDSI